MSVDETLGAIAPYIGSAAVAVAATVVASRGEISRLSLQSEAERERAERGDLRAALDDAAAVLVEAAQNVASAADEQTSPSSRTASHPSLSARHAAVIDSAKTKLGVIDAKLRMRLRSDSLIYDGFQLTKEAIVEAMEVVTSGGPCPAEAYGERDAELLAEMHPSIQQFCGDVEKYFEATVAEASADPAQRGAMTTVRSWWARRRSARGSDQRGL